MCGDEKAVMGLPDVAAWRWTGGAWDVVCVWVDNWRKIDPTSTSLIWSGASNPTWSAKWKPGRLGHLDWFGKGLGFVAMYPKSPSLNCGRRNGLVPRKMAWNTMLWVVDWTNGTVEVDVMEGNFVGRDWEQREMERNRTVEEEA